MRLPLGWLHDHVDPGWDADTLAERLADSGTAIEAVEQVRVDPDPRNLELFRVGVVTSAEQHPNADRLRVCMVDVGESVDRQIVCGASNAREGITVAVALPGARLPGSEPLGRAKLRGVESHGMICSDTELGVGADGSGIMELPAGIAPGTLLSEILPLSETVLDCEITSNRPDCLSVYGLAREVHAISGAPLAPLDVTEPSAEGTGSVEDYISLTVEDPDLCPRYMARVFTDVTIGESPSWLQARLLAAGMRPINNIVDVTNYVMLLTGQPLHAFDLDRMAGAAVVVRRASPDEPIMTLDSQTRRLTADMLAICDAEKPMVIAGIMGAEEAEVGKGTTRVLLEAANFDGPTILRTSLALGLRTESSGRFEKGLPPELTDDAVRLATRMFVELCGARWVPGTLDARVDKPPTAEPVRLRFPRMDALLGIEIAPDEARTTLSRLGFDVTDIDGGLEVAVPYFRRSDVGREADLIEEVGRVHGYRDVPVELPRLVGDGRRDALHDLEMRLERRAADLGFHEIVSYRFVPESDADALQMADDDPRRDVLRLVNPISEEMAVMRRSMLPGLLRAAARNQRHQRPYGALFEIGRTYGPAGDGLADERRFLASLTFGASPRDHWRAEPRPNDIFAGLGDAAALCAVANISPSHEVNHARYFHPVRQARLLSGDEIVGWVGEIHPRVLANFDVTGPATAIVLDIDAMVRTAPKAPRRFEDLLTVPVSTRDLALVVPQGTSAAALVETAREVGGALLRSARVFDRYEGPQVGEGRVSLAVRLTIADPGRTLTDDEIQAVVDRVHGALTDRHSAEIRS